MAVWAPAYINTSEGLGITVINLIKGSLQLTTGIIDKALDSSMGVLEIGAIVILLALLAAAVGYGAKSLRGVKNAG